MVNCYLWVFIAICTGLLGWGMTRPDRIYQYPFFMGAIFVSFILPQAISLINNPGPVSQEALERVLLMSCFCAAMCWLGYQIPPHVNFIKKLQIKIDNKKLSQGGACLFLIASLAAILIARLPESATKNTQATGIFTIYLFFLGLIYPAFTIFFTSSLRQPNKARFLLTILASVIPLQTIIFGGRREVTAIFFVTIGLCLYYFRRFLPPKWLILILVVGSSIIIPLTDSYRAIAGTGQWEQLLQLRPLENFQKFIENGKILELRNAALIMDATVKTGLYGYGTGYWNILIFRFVPAQFVGRSLKEALSIKLSEQNLSESYGYFIPTGTTLTGMGDSFVEFDYFGALFFGIQAYIFKNLWLSAVYGNSLVSQLFYISLVSSALLSVTHGTMRFIPDLIFYIIFLGAVFFYSQEPNLNS